MVVQARVLPLVVVRGQRLVWTIKPVLRPELAGQAQEWIFEIVQGLIME